MKKLPYKEGDIFGVPLRNGGFALGVVARSPKEGKVLLGYFFHHGKAPLPTEGSVPELNPKDAVLVAKFGDLSLYRKEWTIVGQVSSWNRRAWPMPAFIRRDPLSDGRAWKITYSEDDPSKEVAREPISPDAQLGVDGLLGAGAVEIALTKLAESNST